MTDRETFEAMISKVGTKYKKGPIERRRAGWPSEGTVIEIEVDALGIPVWGYPAFAGEFVFDANGAFVGMGFWE